MSDYLTRLAERTLGSVETIRPNLAPVFAPGPAIQGDKSTQPEAPGETPIRTTETVRTAPTGPRDPIATDSDTRPTGTPAPEQGIARQVISNSVPAAPEPIIERRMDLVPPRSEFHAPAPAPASIRTHEAALDTERAGTLRRLDATGVPAAGALPDRSHADEPAAEQWATTRARRRETIVPLARTAEAPPVDPPAGDPNLVAPTARAMERRVVERIPQKDEEIATETEHKTQRAGAVPTRREERAALVAAEAREDIRRQRQSRNDLVESTALMPAEPALPVPSGSDDPGRNREQEAPTTVTITIGRIDVRAVIPPTPPPASQQQPARRPVTMSLDDYLRKHNGAKG